MTRRLVTSSTLLLLALVGSTASCRSASTARPEAFPRTGASRPAPAAAPTAAPAADVRPGAIPPWLATAFLQQGVRYQLGGASPAGGFDCSGLVQYAFAAHGIAVPRTTAEQFGRGTIVMRPDILPGDLVFFATNGPGPTHVGIAAGDGTFVHAPDAGGVVRVERLDARYWATRFIGARRVAASPGVAAP